MRSPDAGCCVCRHPARQHIEDKRAAGASYRVLAKQCGLSRAALQRHVTVCLRQQALGPGVALEQLQAQLDAARYELVLALDELAHLVGLNRGGIRTDPADPHRVFHTIQGVATLLTRLSEEMGQAEHAVSIVSGTPS